MYIGLTEYGIRIGQVLVPFYGFMIFAGIVSGSSLTIYFAKKYGLDIYDLVTLIAFACLGALIGSKILYLAVSEVDLYRMLTDYQYFNANMKGGFVFYGGLIGGLLSAYIGAKMIREELKNYIAVALPGVSLAHAFGRLGCFLVGCCYGVKYSGPFARIYTHSVFAPNDVGLFPVQLVEAISELLICVLLIYLLKKYKNSWRTSLTAYLLLYSVIRFVLEFFRGDAYRGYFGNLSTSQIISLVIMIFIAAILIHESDQKK